MSMDRTKKARKDVDGTRELLSKCAGTGKKDRSRRSVPIAASAAPNQRANLHRFRQPTKPTEPAGPSHQPAPSLIEVAALAADHSPNGEVFSFTLHPNKPATQRMTCKPGARLDLCPRRNGRDAPPSIMRGGIFQKSKSSQWQGTI